MTTKDFKGVTAFLNGTEGLHEIDQDIYDNMIKNGCVCKILDNLFSVPEKLKTLRHYTNLVLFTTGIQLNKTIPLQTIFINSGYVPENVVFISETTAMAFLHIARDLKNKGTKFWYIDIIDNETLYSIDWI